MIVGRPICFLSKAPLSGGKQETENYFSKLEKENALKKKGIIEIGFDYGKMQQPFIKVWQVKAQLVGDKSIEWDDWVCFFIA